MCTYNRLHICTLSQEYTTSSTSMGRVRVRHACKHKQKAYTCVCACVHICVCIWSNKLCNSSYLHPHQHFGHWVLWTNWSFSITQTS